MFPIAELLESVFVPKPPVRTTPEGWRACFNVRFAETQALVQVG